MENKEHPYFKNFHVSKCGQIFSTNKDRNVMRKLKPHFNDFGYEIVSVVDPQDGRSKKRRVHRLVCETHLPNPYNKPEVNHKDCDKTNNNLNNLEWCTSKENKDHAWANGLYSSFGEAHSGSTLSEELVHSICRAIEDGARNIDLSRIHGIHKDLIARIRTGVSWVHIGKMYNMKKKRVERKSPEFVIKIAEYLETGLDDKCIASILDINQQEVSRVRRRVTHSVLTKDYKF